MSTVPSSSLPAPQADASSEGRAEARRRRRAACSARLRMATDALAAADLLLGLNWSVGQVGAETKR